MKESFENHIYASTKKKEKNISIKICQIAIAQDIFYLIAAHWFFLINYIT